MKHLRTKLPKLFPAPPAEALPRDAGTLKKVLQAIAPQLLDQPQQLRHIRAFLLHRQANFPATAETPIDLATLRRLLAAGPYPVAPEKLEELLLALEGMKLAMEHFGLTTEDQFDAMMQAQKKAFRARLSAAVPHRSDRRCAPGENARNT